VQTCKHGEGFLSIDQLDEPSRVVFAGSDASFVRLKGLFQKKPMDRTVKYPKTVKELVAGKSCFMQAHPLPSLAIGTYQMNVEISAHTHLRMTCQPWFSVFLAQAEFSVISLAE